ncbi:MAG TPA: hypothetical protein VKZ73_10285 [Microbacterium sp.]|nr:hypothetical protein [Microbacterium sp.]
MGRHKKLRPYGSPKFALFGETLLAGLVVALCSLPIVTAVPAIAAGARHIRRHNEGYSDRVSDLFGEVWGAFRRLWALGVGSAGVLALLVIDARVLSIAAIPGARPVAIVLAVAALAAAVVVLRFAGGWDPSDRALPGLRRALTESVADPLGSTLLLLALAGTAVLVWMFPALAVVAGGILALAAYAIDTRLEALSTDPDE